MPIKIDAETYIDALGIDFKTHGKNVMKEHIGISCPLCGDDPDYHMNIKFDLTHCICWRCDYKSFDTMKIVSEIIEGKELTYKELLKIAEEFPIYDDEMALTEEEIDENVRSLKFNLMWKEFISINNYGQMYLEKRGLGKNFYDKWGWRIGINIGKVKFFGRIIIPIRDVSGRIVNFAGRSTSPNAYLRYKNCPTNRVIKPARACLYGLYESLGKDRIVIVEGLIDAAKLIQYNIGTVALSKKIITREQLELLSDNFDRKTQIFISLDSEGASKSDWKKLQNQIGQFYDDVKFLHLSGAKDIGDCTGEQIKKLGNIITNNNSNL